MFCWALITLRPGAASRDPKGSLPAAACLCLWCLIGDVPLVQWLSLCSFAAGGPGSIPGCGRSHKSRRETWPSWPRATAALHCNTKGGLVMGGLWPPCRRCVLPASPGLRLLSGQPCGLRSLWKRAGLLTAVGRSPSLLPGAGPGRWQEVRTKLGIQTAFPTSWKDRPCSEC